MFRKLSRFGISFSLIATLLIGISAASTAPAHAATCAEGGPCALGDTGPGGGKVFYVAPSTFACGVSLNLYCKYLEAATTLTTPSWSDTPLSWSGNTTTFSGATSTAIGSGLANTTTLIAQSSGGNQANTALTKTRGYSGGGRSDWFLPSKDESVQLAARSYLFTDFVSNWYATSSEASATQIWFLDYVVTYGPKIDSKTYSGYSRPVRAFNDGSLPCSSGGTCALGDVGPGGGKVFYVSPSTFSCGPAADLTCKYLEAAPKTWSGGSVDPTAIYAANDYNPTGQSSSPGNSLSGIGRGYIHSISILAYQIEAPTVAAGIARAYLGGGKNDWYLPATAELNLLCQVARGVTQSVTTPCTGGTTSSDFNSGIYWATNGYENSKAWAQDFSTGVQSGQTKRNTLYVRPIRAFGGPAATAPGAATVTSTVVNNAKITVNFTAPTSNGNASITSYKYSTDGGVTFSARSTGTTESPLVITTASSDGLTLVNGTTYSVQIKAVNSVGDGLATTSTSAKVMYVLGDTGPGGGTVYYYDAAGFGCGPYASSTGSPTGGLCYYLEAAPANWYGGTDPSLAWSGNTTSNVTGSTSSAIGAGYQATLAILALNATAGKAGTAARAYAGGGKSDWYLPSSAELANMYTNRVYVPGMDNTGYWSSSESSSTNAYSYNFVNGTQGDVGKSYTLNVRPIRAFGITLLSRTLAIDSASFTSTYALNATPPTLTATASIGTGTKSYTSATPGVCTVNSSSGLLAFVSSGTCSLTASITADSNYAAVTSVAINFTTTRIAQAAFSFSLSKTSKTYPHSEEITMTPSGGSGAGAIHYAISAGGTAPGCALTSSGDSHTVSASGVGTCFIAATKDADSTYLIATSSTQSFTFSESVGLTPVFSSTTSTAGGFTINISNYSADYSFTPTVDTGTVTVGVASATILPLTVTGLAAGSSATISVETARSGYVTTLTTVTGASTSNKTVTFKSNYLGGLADTTQISNISANLITSALSRANFTFLGWNTNADGTGIPYTDGAPYDFSANLPLFAQWIQNSLFGIAPSDLTLVGSLTAAGINSSFEGSTGGSTVAVQYETGSLPTGTVINIHLLSNTSRAATLITTTNSFILSFVVSWLTLTGTVPSTDPLKPLRMTISNTLIKKGASVYSLIGATAMQIGTATADGSVTISITEDPEIVIAIKKPDAPTAVTAMGGADSSALVTWSAPANDGGAEITRYLVTSSGGQTCSPSSLSSLLCSVSGLTNGTDYTFTVTASNTVGVSDSSTASVAVRPLAPVVITPPTLIPGGGGGYTPPTPDPAIAAAEARVAAELKAIAEAKMAAELKLAAEAKAAQELKIAEEARAQAEAKALAEVHAAALEAAAQLAAAEKIAAELKAIEEIRLADEAKAAAYAISLAASKKIFTVYSTSKSFKLLRSHSKKVIVAAKLIPRKSTITCIGYAKSSKTLSYAKAKVVASKQAKALCLSMKKINPTLMTKSIVYPFSKAPVTRASKRWIPISYRVQASFN